MRNVHIIAYDIAEPKRYRRIYPVMCGHGDPLQYSVFRCPLSDTELQSLKDTLWPLLNLAEDRVMIIRLGPVKEGGDDAIEFWGLPCVQPVAPAAIII